MKKMNNNDSKTVFPAGLYAITCEPLSRGRKNLEVVRAMLRGGIDILQYREKDNKTPRQKLEECREIRKMTRQAGILFIVNDSVEIALLCDADGAHVGQEDLPVSEVRRLLGPNKLIGVSTHSPDQALAAVKDGADYIGVGPIFKTQTKKNVCEPVGLEYEEWVASHIEIPWVAIGGIKLHNINEVLKRGARTVALVTEITDAEDIEARVRTIREKV